jgi:hypothetical protein
MLYLTTYDDDDDFVFADDDDDGDDDYIGDPFCLSSLGLHTNRYFERISVLFYEDGFENSAFELGPGQRVVEVKVPPHPQGQTKVAVSN